MSRGGRPAAARALGLAASLALLCDAAAAPSYCSLDALQQYSTGWPKELDWGIYWFGPGDKFEKAVPGQRSQFYDPKKKTVLFFHGWTGKDGGTTASCQRFTTTCHHGHTGCPAGDQPLAENWLAAGWNVGFFYWDQFSDEECTRDAEQKVWFDRDGDGLRWKSFDPQTQEEKYVQYREEGAESVADLCVQAVEQNLGDHSGGEVRFIGHSIGAQLAVRCAGKLHMWESKELPAKVTAKLLGTKAGHPAAPQRLALLEPYFTKHHFGLFRCHQVETGSGVGRFTATALSGYVENLKEKYNVVTEVYKSSAFTEDIDQLGVHIPQPLMNEISQVGVKDSAMSQFGDSNHELEKVATVVQYQPDWCDSASSGGNSKLGQITDHLPKALKEKVSEFDDLECRHAAVIALYFSNYGLPPPRLASAKARAIGGEPGSAIEGCETPSPTCTDGQIKEWIERQENVHGVQRWVQEGGKSTFEGFDDTFAITPDLDENEDKVVILAATERPPQTVQEPWWHLKGSLPKIAAGVALGLVSLAILGVSVRLGAGLYRHTRGGNGSDSDDDWKDHDEEHGDDDFD